MVKNKRFLVASAMVALCVLAPAVRAQAAAPAPAPAPGAAPAAGQKTREEKLAELWENLIHFIRIAQHEAATSFGQALLDFGAQPNEIYYLSAQTPGSLATLARGRQLKGLEKITEQLLKETVLTTSGDATLTIRGRIVYIDMQGVGSGAISPMEQLVCHVQLVDPSGDVLGWAAVAGVNKSRARGAAAGEAELCDGLGKGIVLWLTRNGVPEKPED